MNYIFHFLLLAFIILSPKKANTQSDAEMYAALQKQKLGYKFSKDIDINKNESVCFDLCAIGKDKDAQKCYDRFYPSIIFNNEANYYVFSCQSYINNYIKRSNPRLIAINEAHHASHHRVFMQSLLPYLYQNGYRHLAIEGLSKDDLKINERKFPKFMFSGFYLRDPEFGNMVRKALELGFTLIAYDQRGPNREEKSANELCDYIFENKVDKLIVYAGYDHIREKMPPDKKSLVMYLNDYLRTDAFTISQTEHLGGVFKYAPDICEKFYILNTLKGQVYSGIDKDVDIAVFHNDNDLVSDYIFPGNVELKLYSFFQHIKYPTQIQIKILKEGLMAIPVAVKEINSFSEWQQTSFSLEKGKEYEIQFIDETYKIYKKKNIIL